MAINNTVEETDVMTVQEVATYLRLNEITVYKLARSGEIPALKIGRNWRFKKELIDAWFRQSAEKVGNHEGTEDTER